MYERRRSPPIPRPVFLRRLASHSAVSLLLVAASLVVGMWGYAHYEHLGWLDAFLNASMLLGGEGPVAAPASPGGKVFAGIYALYSGLVFLVAISIVMAPVLHRMMHQFHWQTDEKEGEDGGPISRPRP